MIEQAIVDIFREFGLLGGSLVLGFILFIPSVLGYNRIRYARAQAALKTQERQDAMQARVLDMLEERTNELRQDAQRLDRNYQTQIADLQARFDDYQTTSENERAEQRELIATLTADKERLERRIEALAKELAEVKQLYQAERVHNADLQASNKGLLEINDKLVATNRQQVEQIIEQSSQIATLNEKVSHLERENRRLQSEINYLAQQLQTLTGQASPPVVSPTEPI